MHNVGIPQSRSIKSPAFSLFQSVKPEQRGGEDKLLLMRQTRQNVIEKVEQ